jgi:hypothetical protein
MDKGVFEYTSFDGTCPPGEDKEHQWARLGALEKGI